jgi:hypothetical protein
MGAVVDVLLDVLLLPRTSTLNQTMDPCTRDKGAKVGTDESCVG